MKNFRTELEQLLNTHSKENGSNTPDFILADYLCACLAAFDAAVASRTRWYSPIERFRGTNTTQPGVDREAKAQTR